MIYFQDNHVTIYNKDCRDMGELPDNSVQCVVTSPPYWGLRKYSGEQDSIWGDNHGEHQWGNELGNIIRKESPGVGAKQEINASRVNFCSLCGAWKGAYGLEPTPEMYIQHTIEILREIRRVLRKDGVVFWNIGDSYAANRSYQVTDTKWRDVGNTKGSKVPEGLKPKDLCLIPFRVAIAAQEDGWWVRSVIIWSKLNPMPESVTDRPTESHEYLLMLTQSGKSLYWTHRDSGGTREKPKADYRWVNQLTQEEVAIEPPDWRLKIKCPECEGTGIVSVYLGLEVWQDKKCDTCHGRKETQLWKRINLWKGHDYYWDVDAVREPINPNNNGKVAVRPSGNSKTRDKEHWGVPHERKEVIREYETIKGRNIRTVWEFPTQPYPEAHFAVFPEKLPELCIKAATPEVGCCSKCGAPWERISEVQYHNQSKTETEKYAKPSFGTKVTFGRGNSEHQTLGWQPTCKCNADKVPSIVLDPFMGAGTTLWVAKVLNRRAVGHEISEEYCALALERNRQMVMEL